MGETRTSGSLPPRGKEWQAGKTAATIRFVDEAEAALEARDDIEDREKHVLRTLVQAMKGILEITAERNVQFESLAPVAEIQRALEAQCPRVPAEQLIRLGPSLQLVVASLERFHLHCAGRRQQ